MSSPGPRSLLSRRTVLLAGALLAPLGLSGCDGEESGPQEETAPPPVELTFTAVDVPDSAKPGSPLNYGFFPVSSSPDRSMAALVRLGTEDGTALRLVGPTRVGGLMLPIDPVSRVLAVDDSAAAVRVFSCRTGQGGYITTLHTSSDLSTWTESPLDAEIDAEAAGANDGLLVSSQQWRRIEVRAVADDGAVTELTPITVDGTQLLHPRGIARDGDRIVLLVLFTDLAVDRHPELPAIISSQDGGATWSAPELLPGPLDDRSIGDLRFHGEQFVVLGRKLVKPDWTESSRYWRPTHWVSSDGHGFTEKDIPLPTWGLDGWTWDEKGDVDASTEMDMIDLSTGPPVIDHEDGTMHVPVYQRNDLRIASRAPDGTWEISERHGLLDDLIEHVVADPSGAVLGYPESVTGVTAGGEHGQWESAGMFVTSPSRALSLDSGPLGSPVSMLMRTRAEALGKDEDDDGWEEVSVRRDASAFGVDGNVLTTIDDVPAHATVWQEVTVRSLGDRGVLLLGFEEDDEGTRRLRGLLHDGAEWIPTDGLDRERVYDIRTLTVLGSTYHLCATRSVEESSVDEPVVLVSEDGLSWSELGAFDPTAMTGEVMSRGARIVDLGQIGETVVGVGSTIGDDYYYRAAVFVLEGETWKIVPVPDARAGSTVSAIDRVGSRTEVRIWAAGVVTVAEAAADGSVTRFGQPTDHSWGRVFDLGRGVLLAGGELTRALAEDGDGPSGVGACVWVSRDTGQTWDAVPFPPGVGTGISPAMMRDGADMVAAWMQDGTIHSYRIMDPAQQVLPEAEPTG